METKISAKLFVFVLLVITPVFHLTTVPDIALLPRFVCWSVTLLFGTFLFVKTKSQTNALILPDIVFLLYYLLTGLSLFWALNTANAVFEIQKVFAAFVTYLFLRILLLRTEGKIIPFILRCNLILTALILVVVFLQIITHEHFGRLIFKGFKKVEGFSAQRNLLCSFLYLTLVFNVLRIIYSKSKKWRLVYLFPIIIQILIILLFQVRAVYMALFVSGVCFLIGFQFVTKYFNLKRAIIFAGILFLLAGCVLARLVLVDDDFKVYLEKINVTEYRQSKTGKERIRMWKRSTQIIGERALTGVGAGNWAIFYPNEDTKVRVEFKKFTFFQRPHNDFIWVFSEIGIVGGLAYLALFVFVIIAAFQFIIKKENTDERLKILVLFCGLLGYIIIANFSFPKERIEHQIWLVLILSMLVYYLHDYFKNKPALSLSKINNGVWIGLLLVGLCFNLLIGYYRYQGEKVMKLVYANSLSLADKKQMLDNAQSYFYQSDHVGFPLFWHQGMTANAVSQSAEALEYFIKAYELHPNNFRILNDLAAAYNVAGNYDEAIRHFENAHKLYPEGQATIYNLAILHYRLKSYAVAIDWAEKLSEDYPRKGELIEEIRGK